MLAPRLTKTLCAVLAATALVVVAPASPVTAQTPAGAASVSVSPPTTELDVNPGQTVTREVSLINGSDQARQFTASLQNFQANGEYGQAALSDDENPYALKPYLSISPNNVTIKPSETQKFTVTIKLPNDIGPGSRYGAVVFTPAKTNDPNANLSVISEVSSLLLVRVPGNATEQASLASFSTQDLKTQDGKEVPGSDKTFFQNGPVNFGVRIKNDGNVGLKPTAKVTVKNIFGKKVAELDATPQNVLPGSVRRYDVKWDHSHLLGRYKAEVVVTYGSTNQTLTSSTSFWGAPLVTVAIVVGVLVLLFLLLWLPRKRLRAAMRALASGSATESATPDKAAPAPGPEADPEQARHDAEANGDTPGEGRRFRFDLPDEEPGRHGGRPPEDH